jgi:hypothetical protein
MANPELQILLGMLNIFEGGKYWIVGEITDRNGGYCMLGAMKKARRINGISGDHTHLLLHKAVFEHCRESIAVFNDNAKSYDIILQVILRAIEFAEDEVMEIQPFSSKFDFPPQLKLEDLSREMVAL